MAASMKRMADCHLAPAPKKFKDDSAAKIGDEAYNKRLQLVIAMVNKTTAKVAPVRLTKFIDSAPAPSSQQRKRQPKQQLQQAKQRRPYTKSATKCYSRPNSSSFSPTSCTALEKKSSCNNGSAAAPQDALLPLNDEVPEKKEIAAAIELGNSTNSNSSSSDSDSSSSSSDSDSSGSSTDTDSSSSESEEDKEDAVAVQETVTVCTPAAWPKLPINNFLSLSSSSSSSSSGESSSDSTSDTESEDEIDNTVATEVPIISDVPNTPTASLSCSSSDSGTESPRLTMNKKPSLILVLRRRRDGPTPTWFVHQLKHAE